VQDLINQRWQEALRAGVPSRPRVVKSIAKRQSNAIILEDKVRLLADIEHLRTQFGRMATALDKVYNDVLSLKITE
jgi:hypothetical protein